MCTYFENQGIVHRDLKPNNIMIGKNKTDQTIILKVVDFGMAALTVQKPLLIRCGTPGYIAPEVLQQDDKRPLKLNPKIDVYSLGVIGY